MDGLNDIELLLLRSKIKKPFELKVTGSSMNPILHNKDTIIVCSKDDYEVGDILVFLYKSNELLVHRLLKKQNGRYFCKGDNSFRLEDIDKTKIIGFVMLSSDVNNNFEFIAASLEVSRLFRHCGYNVEIMKASSEFEKIMRDYYDGKNHHENLPEEKFLF